MQEGLLFDVGPLLRGKSGDPYDILSNALLRTAEILSAKLDRPENHPEQVVRETMTTIFGVETKDGAIMAADSRGTLSGGGRFQRSIGSFNKLVPLLDRASFGFSGAAAAGLLMSLILEEDFEMYENLHETILGDIELMSAKTMAQRVNLYTRVIPWCVPLFAVLDMTRGRARLFNYDGAGSMVEVEGYVGAGSGFPAIQELLGRESERIREMKAEEALPLVIDIMIAAQRGDLFTGGDFRFHLLTLENFDGLWLPGVTERFVGEDAWEFKHRAKNLSQKIRRGTLLPSELESFRNTLKDLRLTLAEVSSTGTGSEETSTPDTAPPPAQGPGGENPESGAPEGGEK